MAPAYGRNPSTPDARDFKLADYLASPDPLDAALAAFLKKHYSQAAKDLATLLVQRVEAFVNPPAPPGPTPTPIPVPPPAPSDSVVWEDVEAVLDQGQTPHCVGFGSAQWGNTLPVDDRFTNADGDAIYYECKVIDGEPGAENGSSARSSAKALQNRGRLKTYAFASSIDEVRTFIRTKGAVMFATDWYYGMETPDANGFVKPTGGIAGGHYYLAIGDHPAEGAIEFLNSWGPVWGNNGRFKMKVSDAAKLLAQQGEAVAAVELS